MKQFIIKTILALIFIVLLDSLFFIFTDVQTCPDSVWAAFAGLNIGYLALFLIPLMSPRENGLMVLSAQLYLVGVFYYMAEVIVGLVFLFVEQPTLLWPVVIQSVLLALYIIVLLSSVLANDATRKSIARQDSESRNIRFMAEQANEARRMLESDANAYKQLSRLYDDLATSPLRSSEESRATEEEIYSSLMLLKSYAEDGDVEHTVETAAKIRQLVAKRNFQIKNIQHY